MAYWDSNIIEYKESTKPSCRYCRYYRDDKSCEKTGQYIPDIGYNFWRYCKYFELDAYYDIEAIRERVSNAKRPKKAHAQKKQPDQTRPQKPNYSVGGLVVNREHQIGKIVDVTEDSISVNFSDEIRRFNKDDRKLAVELKPFAACPVSEKVFNEISRMESIRHRKYGVCQVKAVTIDYVRLTTPVGKSIIVSIRPALHDGTLSYRSEAKSGQGRSSTKKSRGNAKRSSSAKRGKDARQAQLQKQKRRNNHRGKSAKAKTAMNPASVEKDGSVASRATVHRMGEKPAKHESSKRNMGKCVSLANPRNLMTLQVGQEVEHPLLGRGVVFELEPRHVHINFSGKTVVLPR
jgi:hypothetical protein